MSNSKVKVYWAPVFFEKEKDWNMFYTDLESLYDFHRENISKESKTNNFFYCPAFKNLTKNTFLIKNPIHSHFILEGQIAKAKSKNYVEIDITHDPSIQGSKLITYMLQFIFFSETPLILKLTSPFFNQIQYTKYGALVPGQLKINSWFRTLNLEINMWPEVNELELLKDEILAYISFESQEQDIELIRFEMNDKLHRYASSCGTATQWESFVPLYDRYKRFMQSRTNKLVINEIKKNIINV
jgi:hypothetical protein